MNFIKKHLYGISFTLLFALLALEFVFGVDLNYNFSEDVRNLLIAPTLLSICNLFCLKNALKYNDNLFLIDKQKKRYQSRGKLEKYRTISIVHLSLSLLWLVISIILLIIRVSINQG